MVEGLGETAKQNWGEQKGGELGHIFITSGVGFPTKYSFYQHSGRVGRGARWVHRWRAGGR